MLLQVSPDFNTFHSCFHHVMRLPMARGPFLATVHLLEALLAAIAPRIEANVAADTAGGYLMAFTANSRLAWISR